MISQSRRIFHHPTHFFSLNSDVIIMPKGTPILQKRNILGSLQ